MKLTVLESYVSYYKGYNKGYTKMKRNKSTVEWRIRIGYHSCSVTMVISQKSHFHEINLFWVVFSLLSALEIQGRLQNADSGSNVEGNIGIGCVGCLRYYVALETNQNMTFS